MPSFERESNRIVIAGASSLLGAELKSLLEESRFAGWDLRLVDEEIAAGTLTEAGGEPAVIQPVEEGSFEKARFVFFAGSPEFVECNFRAALAAGAVVIDFSGGVCTKDDAPNPWFPKLDEFWGTRFAPKAPTPTAPTHFWIPSAAAVAATSLSFGLKPVGLKKLNITFFRPVSEAGRAGIEELESQTGQLLSFQSVGQPVFDAQVAFNMLDAYGAVSTHKLDAVCERVRAEVKVGLGKSAVVPSVQVIHAPVFYGTMFSACAEVDPGADAEKIARVFADAGFALTARGEAGPSNV